MCIRDSHLVADIVYGGIHTVGSHPELLFAGTDFSGIDNLVLRLQQTGKLFRVDAQDVYKRQLLDYLPFIIWVMQ